MSSSKPKHRIVVVEDDRTSRQLISRILEVAGYDVFACSEVRDALHIAEMNPPRAMVIDVVLPDVQGTKIVQELGEHKAARFTKYLFLTGILTNKPEDRNYFFRLDGKRYRAIPKPVRKGQLLKHLADAVTLSLEEEAADRRAREDAETERIRIAEAKKAKKPAEVEEEITLSSELY